MSGLILYSVNPRSLGTVPEWTTALAEAERLGCNSIHLNPFHPVTNIRKNYHGANVSGSLYAIRDHFTINPEFCVDGDAIAARAQLKDFIKMARANNIRVFADLVFNHVAADHPLVTSNPELFKHNADGTLHVPGPADDPWSDVAAVDYEHPAAWEFFLGTHGYWLRMLDDYLDLGFNGLRCDAVYWLPQLVWEQAINHVLRRDPDVVILAETLGLSGQDAVKMQEAVRESDTRIIYDVCYDDTARLWDGHAALDLNQARGDRFQKAAHYGAMGFVDSHDFTPRAKELRAEFAGRDDLDKKIAAACLRDYAIACFTNNSVMMLRGFQWCIESNVGPFREQVSAEFFKALKQDRKAAANPLTLGPAIAELHKLRGHLPANVTVRISDEPELEGNWKYLSAIRCDFMTHGDERLISTFILLINTAAEFGPQRFPHDFWQHLKEGQSNAQKFQFGTDRKHQDEISGVAILVIPGGLETSMKFDQGRKVNLTVGAPEPSLVA